MATSKLIEALQELAHERKIDEFYLIERLEESLANSYQRILDLEWDARVTIDRQTGKIYVYELVPVGEPDEETGEYAEFEERDVTPNDVSRIAAQNAKSVIAAIVRDAGRQSIYEEFSGRVGDLVTGTGLQGTPDFTIIKIRDGVEAELPHYDQKRYPSERNERPAGEHYRHNQRLKVLIIDVRDPSSDAPRARGEAQRPSIVVSRTHPDLIRRLFEIEVPEIYDGLVEVKSIAREPGVRSKVAVASRESNLDPVGACVGPKGSRVRMVVEELRNERVDVIQWSDNPATYVGVFDDIRNVFAEMKESKMRGYGKDRFSFNVKGGRCEACWGDGVKRIEMNFLPDVYVPCEVCKGTRYNRETLQVKFKDKSIADVLNMRVSEAIEFFDNIPKVKNKLQVMIDVGLSYIQLGQSAPTLSGGEAGRVKLAKELQKKATGKSVFILDEPTTGLHTDDIKKLLLILQRIVDNGDTVIVIEHNLDVIKVADYIIDLGPEGGTGGGTVVATGTPEKVAKVKESYTGQFLKKIL